MNAAIPQPDPLEPLVGALLGGRITEAQQHQLADALRSDAQVRRRFLDQMELHALLNWELHRDPAVHRGAVSIPRPRHRATMVRYAAAAVIVLVFTSLMALLIQLSTRERAAEPGPPVATLIETDRARWDVSDEPTAPGSQLRGGFLRLKSGRAMIEFYSGAQVTLTGPCEFGLNSEKRGFLKQGKLTAYVPPRAHGFTVGAPGCAVVDLGTAFGMLVNADRITQVHVFKGLVRVELRDAAGHVVANRKLRQQTAAQVNANASTIRPMDFEPDPFAGITVPDWPGLSAPRGRVLAWYELGQGTRTLARLEGPSLEPVGRPAVSPPDEDGRRGISFKPGEYLRTSLGSLPTEGLQMEVWAKARTTAAGLQCLAYLGDPGSSGMGLYQAGENWAAVVGGLRTIRGSAVQPGRWTRLALFYRDGSLRLYVDGELATETQITPRKWDTNLTLGGRSRQTREAFTGTLAAVRVNTMNTNLTPSLGPGAPSRGPQP